MASLPLGIILTCVTLFVALQASGYTMAWNIGALILVCGGTIGILHISCPGRQLRSLLNNLWRLRKPLHSLSSINQALLKVTRNREVRMRESHPLIRYAQELWEEKVDDEMFVALLTHQLDEMNQNSATSVAALRNLGKYPTALGMMGTVIGLVSIFFHLTPDNKATIGPSLAFVLTTTFYGLVLANLLVMPLADRLQIFHENHLRMNRHVYDTILLIHNGAVGTIVKESLNVRAA